MTEDTIPVKASRYFDEIVTAVHKGTLILMKGYFNGDERILLCIEQDDPDDPECVMIFPRALVLDEDIDSLHDYKRRPLGEGTND